MNKNNIYYKSLYYDKCRQFYHRNSTPFTLVRCDIHHIIKKVDKLYYECIKYKRKPIKFQVYIGGVIVTDKSSQLRMMIITSLFAAIISVLAQVSIPMPLGVPITGQTLAIGLAATILGSRYGTLSALLYMIIGAVGVPVFAQFTGGPGVLLGPTGGFIVGFIPTTFIMGYYLEKTK